MPDEPLEGLDIDSLRGAVHSRNYAKAADFLEAKAVEMLAAAKELRRAVYTYRPAPESPISETGERA